MKKLFAFAFGAMMLAGCASEEETTMQKTIAFSCQYEITQMTRAALSDEGCTDLWVMDGQEVVAHQLSTDADFGSLSLTLDYGTHQLSFLASKSTGTIANGVFTPERVRDNIFGKTLSLMVDKNTTGQNISLERIVAALVLKVTDAMPSDIDHIEVKMPKHYADLTTATLLGKTEAEKVSTTAIPASYIGSTDVTISSYSFCPSLTEQWKQDIVITAKRADGTVISSFTVNDVPMQMNYKTILRGRLFGEQSETKVTVASDAWNENEVEF